MDASEYLLTVFLAILIFCDGDAFDHITGSSGIFFRIAAGYSIDHIHAFGDLAKYCVTAVKER